MQRGPDDIALDWLTTDDPTARRLVQAALHEFASLGYHGASTRSIAARAGMSPAAVYISFSSKAALLHRITIDGHRSIQSLLDRLAAMHPDPVNRLYATVAEFVAWHATHSRLASVVEYNLDALDPADRSEVADVRRSQESHFLQLVRRAAAASRADVPDPVLATRAIISMAIDVARWYKPSSRATPALIGQRYAGYALRIVGCPGASP